MVTLALKSFCSCTRYCWVLKCYFFRKVKLNRVQESELVSSFIVLGIEIRSLATLLLGLTMNKFIGYGFN